MSVIEEEYGPRTSLRLPWNTHNDRRNECVYKLTYLGMICFWNMTICSHLFLCYAAFPYYGCNERPNMDMAAGWYQGLTQQASVPFLQQSTPDFIELED
ncbi:hypothetical protein BgiBS90_003862 [Biomphalaria glabrata]|nr:hypothetical protein BgiBS90_003862 [Biomphalaria glabrata]